MQIEVWPFSFCDGFIVLVDGFSRLVETLFLSLSIKL